MRSQTSAGVSQEAVVDSLEVCSVPPEGLQRKTRATMSRVGVLVDAGEYVDLAVDACLCPDFAGYAGFWGVAELEYASGKFPGVQLDGS